MIVVLLDPHVELFLLLALLQGLGLIWSSLPNVITQQVQREMALAQPVTDINHLVHEQTDFVQIRVLVVRNCLVFHSKSLLGLPSLSFGLLAFEDLLHGFDH